MGLILKIYATALILDWVIGTVCILCGKKNGQMFDAIVTIMGILLGIGLIGALVFIIWSLWNL